MTSASRRTAAPCGERKVSGGARDCVQNTISQHVISNHVFIDSKKLALPFGVSRNLPSKNSMASTEASSRRSRAAAPSASTATAAVSAESMPPDSPSTTDENPHFRFGNGVRRGYGILELSQKRCVARFRTVSDVTDPQATVRTLASFTVEDGRPGVHRGVEGFVGAERPAEADVERTVAGVAGVVEDAREALGEGQVGVG